MRPTRLRAASIAFAAGVCAILPLAAGNAQSLRGSPASINRMYRHARSEDFSFFQTSASVRRAVAKGYLVQLWPDLNFTLHEVGYPFVRPATQTFVQRLAAQYVAACGEQLEVTSAVRPATRQPSNSVEKSVHPTGMAVDLHKPTDHPKCLRWLRNTLLELEETGVIEATEEFAPPHFHIAVYSTPYRRYVAALASSSAATTVASSDRGGSSTYRVRPGDTLWDIAREHDTTVSAIASANNLDDGDAIQPGQKLIIPDGG
jgi:LysM repeat protein